MSKILVSVNFAGRYNEKNIGHEFINLFPDSKNEWHFYVPPYGTVNSDFNELDYLLLVQHIDRKYSLIALATNLKSTNVFSRKDKDGIDQENKKNGSLVYFGKTLNDWFEDQENTLFVSYNLKDQNSKIFFPTKEINVEFEPTGKSYVKKKNCIYLPRSYYGKEGERQKITGQSLVGYFKVNGFENQIKAFSESENPYLIEKTIVNSSNKNHSTYQKSFLDVIGKPSDELAISNWLNEYLQNDRFFDFFLENCCEIKSHKTTKRESKLEQSTSNRNRVDFWIEDDSYIVLIENKVQSSIHTSTIKDKKAKENKVVSQLYDYLQKGRDEADKTGKTLLSFLMCPDYYSSYYYVENVPGVTLWDKGDKGENWKEIKYSKVKECLESFIKNELKTDEERNKFPYISEFIKALDKHCKDTPFSMKDIILDRVAKKI